MTEHDQEFLSLAAWEVLGTTFEIASRRRLDTRQVVPYFVEKGVTWAGALLRDRVSRSLRNEPLAGYEPIGIDFGHVDETGDILEYGKAIFASHAHVTIDESALKIPLPSFAKSIGYLTELALPLLVAVVPPPTRTFDVSWDGATHQVVFRPLAEWQSELETRKTPHSEDFALLMAALSSPTSHPLRGAAATDFLTRQASKIWSWETLSARLEGPIDASSFHRKVPISKGDLRFLRSTTLPHAGVSWDVLTPRSGVSLAALPYVIADGHAYFLLWLETRPSALERRARQPIYDSPIHPRYLNATACFLSPEQATALSASASEDDLREATRLLLRQTLGGEVNSGHIQRLGRAAEPAPSVSSELRHRVAVELDATSLSALSGLPDEVCLMRDDVLAEAVADGLVRDPVIALGLATLAIPGADPFARTRAGEVTSRLSFLNAMTAGSTVQRRLRTYSSIEREQLASSTYARLMTLLQHDYGVRVVYPKTEADRTFFKAAFRVFMASDREENRALQGLHWSHDAYHFALGNFTLPPMDDFRAWYLSDDPAPQVPESDPRFSDYVTALKAAEDEATFFSFWTLFAEAPSLTKYVDQLTYWEATTRLGVQTRQEARAIFDDVTTRSTLPAHVSDSDVYKCDEKVRALFSYMLGFREYHLKDIKAAWKFASKEPYRGFFTRFHVYEHDLGSYLAHVKSFQTRLDDLAPGLNPLLAALADVRVSLQLRVWDVVKALKLIRAKKGWSGRAAFLEGMTTYLDRLTVHFEALSSLRASITNAEIVPRNEDIHGRIQVLARDLESVRDDLWDFVAGLHVLENTVIAEERTRELPR